MDELLELESLSGDFERADQFNSGAMRNRLVRYFRTSLTSLFRKQQNFILTC